MKKTVACFGSGTMDSDASKTQYDRMRTVGRMLGEDGLRIITGGYGGPGMEAPVRGAREAHAETIGYPLHVRDEETRPNGYLDRILTCGLDSFLNTNTPSMQWCIRLGHLLQADGFVADLTDGTPETFAAILSIANLNKTFWKPARPLAILPCLGEGITLIDFLMHEYKLKHWGVAVFDDPVPAVQWLLEMLARN